VTRRGFFLLCFPTVGFDAGITISLAGEIDMNAERNQRDEQMHWAEFTRTASGTVCGFGGSQTVQK